MTYIPRNAESRLQHFASGYPVVVVTGPRQSGKSKLVRHAFPDHHYVSLDDLDQREFAETDPRGFLNQFGGAPSWTRRNAALPCFLISRHASMNGNNPANLY
jgi:hypothetical protein